jgi:hypothetical protein
MRRASPRTRRPGTSESRRFELVGIVEVWEDFGEVFFLDHGAREEGGKGLAEIAIAFPARHFEGAPEQGERAKKLGVGGAFPAHEGGLIGGLLELDSDSAFWHVGLPGCK